MKIISAMTNLPSRQFFGFNQKFCFDELSILDMQKKRQICGYVLTLLLNLIDQTNLNMLLKKD